MDINYKKCHSNLAETNKTGVDGQFMFNHTLWLNV